MSASRYGNVSANAAAARGPSRLRRRVAAARPDLPQPPAACPARGSSAYRQHGRPRLRILRIPRPSRGLPVCGVDVVSVRKRRESMDRALWLSRLALVRRCAVRHSSTPSSREVVLLVGNTYEVEASWSALWACLIGLARTRQLDSDPQPLMHDSPSVNGAALAQRGSAVTYPRVNMASPMSPHGPPV